LAGAYLLNILNAWIFCVNCIKIMTMANDIPKLPTDVETLLVLKDIRFWIKFWSIVGVIVLIISSIVFFVNLTY